jgi:hypothetical protein
MTGLDYNLAGFEKWDWLRPGISVRKLTLFVWVNVHFVVEFRLDVDVQHFQAALLRHDVANHSRVGLPLLFAFSLVVLPEVLIRLEDGKFRNRY